jgi:hypothetical protein
MGGGKGSAPPPPDYAGAAQQQGIQNVEAAIAQRVLNNPVQQTPYGTKSSQQVSSYTLADGREIPIFQDTTALTPMGQQRFDQEQRIIGNLGDVAEDGLNRVGQTFGTPFDIQNVNQLQDRAESSIMDRLQPMQDRFRAQRENQLANQGIMMGSEAYRNAQDDIGRQENDARLAAVVQGLNQRSPALQQDLALRNQPLNELNALRTGSQVTVPQFNGPTAQNIAAPDMLGATAAGYNAQLGAFNASQASGNNMMSGLFSLGGSALGGPMGGQLGGFIGSQFGR